MINKEDLEAARQEGHAIGHYVLVKCQHPLSAALAGAALVRAFIYHEMPDSKAFFLEIIAAETDDEMKAVMATHAKPRTAG